MKIVKIKDKYINQLYKVFPHVMLNKNEGGRYGRKYIGVLFKINNFNYYAPLSSPKSKDYIKTFNNLYTIKIILNKNGRNIFYGKIMLNCMIPVPMKYVELISIEKIKEYKYKDLLKNELTFINKNQKFIRRMSKKLYEIKINNNKDIPFIKMLLPYKEIENYINKKR